jgi:pheromone shutdown protein TraB
VFLLKRECLTIIGTAHVSSDSVDEVKDAIYEQHPEVVAIELDRGRYIRLKNEMAGIVEDDTISVTQIIKDNKININLINFLIIYIFLDYIIL